MGCLPRFDTFEGTGLQALSFLSGILTPSPLPEKQIPGFQGLITGGGGARDPGPALAL